MLFFVIKVITHAQLRRCSLPQKDNADLLTQPLYQPAHHIYIFLSAQKSFSAVVHDGDYRHMEPCASLQPGHVFLNVNV